MEDYHLKNHIKLEDSFQMAQLIYILSNQMKRQYVVSDDVLALTPIHKRVLYFLFINSDKKIYQKDIEKEFNIRKSTATGILQLMEKNGFINREICESDRRLKQIKLAQKSYDINEQLITEAINLEQKVIKGIDEKNLETAIAVMKQMVVNLDKMDEGKD